MTDIILAFVPGAGLDASIWEKLTPYLNFKQAYLDYPNRGNAPATNRRLSLQDYYSTLLRQLEDFPNAKILLVAHSLGGIFINKLASELNERLIGIVAIGAIIPDENHSFLSEFHGVQRFIMRVIMRLAGTRPPASQIKSGLCNDLKGEMADKIVSRFTPESIAVYTEKITYPIPLKPCLFILLTNDKSVSVSRQKLSAEKFREAQIHSLDSGHLPMLSQPEKLAGLLNDFTRSLTV